MSRTWKWISVDAALIVHEHQIAEHGGSQGIRDQALLESAMSRPLNLAAYGDPDAAAIAASYAFGLARNHPFVDGNKRTSAVVSEAFLNLNGFVLNVSNDEIVATFTALAAGEIDERELVDWYRLSISSNQRSAF